MANDVNSLAVGYETFVVFNQYIFDISFLTSRKQEQAGCTVLGNTVGV